MKSIEIVVPRMLIRHHHPHPEFYGESIVKLVNGMVSDVYTHETGQLYTITNDEALIDYLKTHTSKEFELSIARSNIVLRSVTPQDLNLIKRWCPHRTKDPINESELSEDYIAQFISHVITRYSHAFIITIEGVESGLCGYTLISENAHLSYEMNPEHILSYQEMKNAFKLLMDWIQTFHDVETFTIDVWNDQQPLEAVLRKLGFVLEESYSECVINEPYLKKYRLYKLNL